MSEFDVESPQAKDFPMPSTSTYVAGPASNRAEPMNSKPSVNYTSFVRFCMYIFFIFYLIFALLILFSGRVDLVHKEHLISQVLELDMEEINIQRMFIMNALFLFVAATLGLFSFYYHKYTIFLSFSVGLLFTMIFACVSLKYNYTAYKKMGNAIEHNNTVSVLFDSKMAHYDWFNMADEQSKFINKFQYEFNCCGGSDGYVGWSKQKPSTLPNGAFPVSCCHIHFNTDMKVKWCSYQDVETKKSCPAAFTGHLVAVQNTLKTQTMLLLEIVLTQFLTITVFFFLIFRGERMFVSRS